MVTSRRGTAATLERHELRVGTSRFLSQDFFLAYRIVLALYFLSWSIFWRGVKDYSTGRYLTHWTWYVATGYAVVSTWSAFLCWRATRTAGTLAPDGPVQGRASLSSTAASPDQSQATTPSRPLLPVALRRLQLALRSAACLVSLIVVAVFWGALYGGEDLTTVDVHAHVIIGIVMLIDQFLIADEYKVRYVIFAQAFGLIYLVFSIGWYYIAPKEDRLLYSVLDWGNETLVACIYAVLCMLVLAPLFALLHFGVYRLRERLYEKLRAKSTTTAGQTLAKELSEGGEFGVV